MGEVHVDVEIENYPDRVLVRSGYLNALEVRFQNVGLLTDTGAQRLRGTGSQPGLIGRKNIYLNRAIVSTKR